jgi:hypothetical protein
VALPIATTTIAIKRPPAADDGKDPYDAKAPMTTVASGVRAAFVSPSGGASIGGGENGITGSQEVVGWQLLADPCDLQHYDTVVDETTTQQYSVAWAKARPDPDGDLDHVVAGVDEVRGAAA